MIPAPAMASGTRPRVASSSGEFPTIGRPPSGRYGRPVCQSASPSVSTSGTEPGPGAGLDVHEEPLAVCEVDDDGHIDRERSDPKGGHLANNLAHLPRNQDAGGEHRQVVGPTPPQ